MVNISDMLPTFRVNTGTLEKRRRLKDKELKQNDATISELLSEKEVLLEEYNRIKRCAKNMDQEIKQLRSRTNWNILIKNWNRDS